MRAFAILESSPTDGSAESHPETSRSHEDLRSNATPQFKFQKNLSTDSSSRTYRHLPKIEEVSCIALCYPP